MTKPKERRIIFPGPDADAKIRAVLKGRLTRHSWPMNPQPLDVITKRAPWVDSATRLITGRRCWCAQYKDNPPRGKLIYCRQCEVGQRLWVAEAYCYKADANGYWVFNADGDLDVSCVWYRASTPDVEHIDDDGGAIEQSPWYASSQMPRKLSRIGLEVAGIQPKMFDREWNWVMDFKRVKP